MNARRILALVAFLAGLVLIDQAVGLVLERIYLQARTGARGGFANFCLAERNKDVIIFGSSRAAHHIDPAAFEREFGLTGLNAGTPGQGIRYARAMESLMLARGTTARLFVLHLDPKNLWGGNYERIARLTPFYGESDALDEMLEERGTFARWKLQSRTYRFNSILLPVVASLAGSKPNHVGNGFRIRDPNHPVNLDAIHPGFNDPGPLLPQAEAKFRGFVEDARAHGVEVVWVVGPRWRPDGMSPKEAAGRIHLEKLARELDVPYIAIDQFTHPEFLDPGAFIDVAHLTTEAAQRFTELLVEALRPIVAELEPRPELAPPSAAH